MQITITRERTQWVARDECGSIRCWAEFDSRWPTAADAARAMFHADEIGNVVAVSRDVATADLLDMTQ